jgi:hypothetical protein
VSALGLRILPSLAEHDIYADGAELDQLERELEILRRALPILYPNPMHQDTVLYRIDNIAAVILIARAHGGGVYIG